jgi:acyl-CoA reductase-like NAD-dependent aldehyde dehydrogenase
MVKDSNGNGPQTLRSIDPRTGSILGEVPSTDPAEVSAIVEQARKVAQEWAAIPPAGRAQILREMRYRLRDRLEDIIEVVSEECGKPRAEALAHEVVPPLLMLAYLERLAPKALRSRRVAPIAGPLLGMHSRMEWRPYGVVGCITPWNFPITNSFLAFASALFAGNVVVVKPSEVTPRCGEILRDLFEPLPAGVATVIQGGRDVGEALVEARCDKIAFIGSPTTGRKICEAAAKDLTPVVMELGGKDASIVCEDADVDVASSGVLWGAFANAGQICASIERTYVVDSVADRFEEQLLSKLRSIRQGEDVGSLTFAPQLEIVARQVTEAVKKGARVLAGGPGSGRTNSNGSLWYAPTVVTDVSDEMSVLKDESFGPVLNLIRVRDEDEAVRRANEDGVNLTASIWTNDRHKREHISAGLRAGTITVNLHAETPAAAWGAWGGVGESGFGRVNGEQGLYEFSVPVHVARAVTPKMMKRAFWYPYDDANEGVFRGVVDVLGSRDIGTKARALPGLLKSYVKAAKSRL